VTDRRCFSLNRCRRANFVHQGDASRRRRRPDRFGRVLADVNRDAVVVVITTTTIFTMISCFPFNKFKYSKKKKKNAWCKHICIISLGDKVSFVFNIIFELFIFALQVCKCHQQFWCVLTQESTGRWIVKCLQ
jgi:hypothetical protein